MQGRRSSAWAGLIGGALALSLVLAGLAGLLYLFDPRVFYPEPEFSRLEAQGDIFIKSIESYHAEHGLYPATLEAAGVSAPKTRWGYWKYVIRADGTYQLSVGEYGRHGFTLFKSAGKEWYRDT